MPVTINDKTFDWKSRHDERSRDYALQAHSIGRSYRAWTEGPTLDQGNEGACVGFGWTAELLTLPVAIGESTFDFAESLYKVAQTLDDWAGEAYEGTSVLAGAKAARQLGFISEYRWCFGIAEVTRAISNHGPVVLGLPWLDSMFNPIADETSGELYLDCSGSEVGGHCILGTAWTTVHLPKLSTDGNPVEVIRLKNSWGESWGKNGGAWIRKTDLATLLANTGEACIAFDRPQAPGIARGAAGARRTRPGRPVPSVETTSSTLATGQPELARR